MAEKVTAESAIKALQEVASKVEDWEAFGRKCELLAILPSSATFPCEPCCEEDKNG